VAAGRVPPVTDTPRHGRLPRRGPVKIVLAFIASALAVVLVSTASIAAIAVWQISSSFEPGVNIQAEGEAPPSLAALDGPVNILLLGSDSGGGNAAYGQRGENLNDVTILLHLSPVSHSATVVSFQRDMYVPIVGCEDGNPGTRKINETLTYGGIACAVSTVEALTGLEIGYAAKIEFDGVLAMSDAVGGVEVCVAEPIHDLQITFDLEAGMHTLQGWDALQFLRSRHGVGDGSDTTRVSNQQLFMAALMRKIKSEGTLTNPITVYSLAKAAAENMQLSTSLSPNTMMAMALVVKDIPTANISFVAYPAGATTVGGVGGVAPRKAEAKVLMDAIAADARVVVTGDPGGGAVAGDEVAETPAPSPSGSPSPTETTPPAENVVELPPSINGQPASEQTCTNGNTF
jgi:LCP family protein required for cell wall assembly